ncbi:MAG: heparan-alpha-glucosaminide N-acetyltransferase domain-containing protein [Clostridium sp.]
MKLLSKEIINSGRQKELDIARGLAVLFMIFIHSQDYFAMEYVKESYFGGFVDFLGGVPAAPVFMFLLGVGIIYTKKDDPKVFIKRGLYLLLAGYVLNFIRGFLPEVILFSKTYDYTYLYYAITELIYVDILQFSGLAMISFGTIKKFKNNLLTVIALMIIFPMLNMILLPIKFYGYLLSAVTGLFWGSNSYSFFPFLTWIVYPLAGFIFGYILIRVRDKKKFYIITCVSSFITMIALNYLINEVFGYNRGLSTELGYYQHSILNNIAFTAFVLWFISVLYFISKYISGNLFKVIGRWSKNVTEIYVIQWILIGWLVRVTDYGTLDFISYLTVTIVIVILSDFISSKYINYKK